MRHHNTSPKRSVNKLLALCAPAATLAQVTPVSHTRFIVGCITALSAIAMGLGFWLLKLGYQSGELLVTNGGVGGISGLVGFLGGKAVMDKAAVTIGNDATITTPPAPPATK